MSYTQCLEEAMKRKDLSLCPRGYCTAKHKFDVYPSAYANGYASQVCKGSKPDFNGVSKIDYDSLKTKEPSNLDRWFKEEWVNVCEKAPDGTYKACGRSSAKLRATDYPYCRPLKKLAGTTVKSVGELTPVQLKSMCERKRNIEPGVVGKPTRVFVADLLIENQETGKYVKVNGRVGKQQVGSGNGYLPNMALVEKYNKLKGKQGTDTYNGQDIVLYAPQLSNKGKTKLEVYVKDPETGKVEVVHFGHRDYQDYTTHRDSARRKSYCARSGGIKCKGNECDVTSANYWSRMALWNCE